MCCPAGRPLDWRGVGTYAGDQITYEEFGSTRAERRSGGEGSVSRVSLNCRKLQTDATWQPSCPFQGGLCTAGKSRTRIFSRCRSIVVPALCGFFGACPTRSFTDGIGIGIADRCVANGLHRLRRMGLQSISDPGACRFFIRASLTGPEGDAI